MTFANPIFLWSLLSLIPLAAIYLLKVRPNRKPTTAYFLWQDIFQERRSNSLFQKLRDLFSLLLMMVAFLAVAFALAKPVWQADDQKDLVLVIDNTASMNAIDSLSTRLDLAKKAASEIVESLGGTQRCSIATVSDRVRYISNLTDNPRDLLEAIAKIQPTEIPFRDGALNEFALSETKDTAPSNDETRVQTAAKTTWRTILISDGLVADIPDSLELLQVGGSAGGNVGIVASDIQRLPGKDRASALIQLASSFDAPVEVEIELSVGEPDNVVKIIPTTVQPGINKALVFELENAPQGRWLVKLVTATDALKSDNRAFLVLHPVKPIPIRVAAEERFFYENSVLAFSGAGGLLQLVTTGGQMLVGQGELGIQLGESAPDDFLAFRPAGQSPWWSEVGDEIEVKLPRATDEDHPVIRHIDVTSIPFVGARRVTLSPAAEILVRAEDDTPLIWRMSQAGKSAVVVNLDPLDSNFYFSAWFPVLVYSSATHLAGRTDELKSTWRTGEVATLPGKDNSTSTLTLPGGETTTLENTRNTTMRQTGHYEIQNDAGQWQAACSLLSPRETLIDNQKVQANLKPIRRGWSPVAWLTIAAILFVTCESVLFQRRKVG